jgi:hypothetical protein
MAANPPKVPCPVCTKPYKRSTVGQHMRQMHAVYGGLSGKPKQQRDNLPAVVNHHLPAVVNGEPEFRRPDGLFLLTDGVDLYVVEKINR